MSITTETETEKMEMPDRNFSLRGKSYEEGMLLLIEYCLPEQDWQRGHVFPARSQLKEIIASLYANYLNALDKASNFKERKEHFDSLLGKYEKLLSEHTTLKDPFKELLKAERYAVRLQGREAFATPVKIEMLSSVGDPIESFSVIQREDPREDSELLHQEAERVTSEDPPLWYKKKLQWEQELIKDNPQLVLKTIPSSQRGDPGLANLSYHTLFTNDVECPGYYRHATQVPVDLLLDPLAIDEAFRLSCLNLASQIKLSLDQQLAKKTDSEKLHEVVILTQSLLSPGSMATFKSQHISDSSDNDTQIYEMKEQAVELFQQAFKDPKTHKAFLEEYGLNVVDNESLQYVGCSIEKITLLSTNRPYNILRRFGVYSEQTKRNDFNTSLLLGAVARYLDEVLLKKDSKVGWPENTTVLKDLFREELKQLLTTLLRCEGEVVSANDRESLIKSLISLKANDYLDKNTLRLLDALQALLSIPPGQGSFEMDDTRHRQSLTSALEVIVINCIDGTPWIACKSGKDRTGGASAAIDAAEIFYGLRGSFPRYDGTKEERALYLQIFKALFESGHHQEVASQNAPGAGGLVNPSTFLPGDITLDANRVQLETQLARLNKPKKRKASKKKGKEGEAFNPHILRKSLDDLTVGAMKKTLGESTVLNDWRRNWNFYFIDGHSVKELRKLPKHEGEEETFEEFKDEADLAEFIKEKLLYKIEDEDLKKDYLEHLLYTFHQSGFPHVFEYLFYKLATEANNTGVNITYSQSADCRINFSPLKNGVEIDALNTFDRKTTEIRGEEAEKTSPKHGGYYYQSNSCISVLMRKNKGKNKLYTKINEASVDCADERLKPLLFRERTLLEVLIDFFMSLCKAFKYWEPAKVGALKESSLPNNNNPRVEKSSIQSNSAKLMPIHGALPYITLGFALFKRFLTEIIALLLPPNPWVDSRFTDAGAMTCKGAFFQLPGAENRQQPSQKGQAVTVVTGPMLIGA